MLRRTPLRRVSKKRQQALSVYRKLKAAHLHANPVCQAEGCRRMATDIHHRLPLGRGGQLNDTSIFMGLCRQCHNACHHNPKWAEEKGYLWRVRPNSAMSNERESAP